MILVPLSASVLDVLQMPREAAASLSATTAGPRRYCWPPQLDSITTEEIYMRQLELASPPLFRFPNVFTLLSTATLLTWTWSGRNFRRSPP